MQEKEVRSLGTLCFDFLNAIYFTGVLALGACAIGLKKADPSDPVIKECHDLILASVVHACQDQAPRVRYYSAESLMNIVRGRCLICAQSS